MRYFFFILLCWFAFSIPVIAYAQATSPSLQSLSSQSPPAQPLSGAQNSATIPAAIDPLFLYFAFTIGLLLGAIATFVLYRGDYRPPNPDTRIKNIWTFAFGAGLAALLDSKTLASSVQSAPNSLWYLLVYYAAGYILGLLFILMIVGITCCVVTFGATSPTRNDRFSAAFDNMLTYWHWGYAAYRDILTKLQLENSANQVTQSARFAMLTGLPAIAGDKYRTDKIAIQSILDQLHAVSYELFRNLSQTPNPERRHFNVNYMLASRATTTPPPDVHFASSYEPSHYLTLKRYAHAAGTQFIGFTLPVPKETDRDDWLLPGAPKSFATKSIDILRTPVNYKHSAIATQINAHFQNLPNLKTTVVVPIPIEDTNREILGVINIEIPFDLPDPFPKLLHTQTEETLIPSPFQS